MDQSIEKDLSSILERLFPKTDIITIDSESRLIFFDGDYGDEFRIYQNLELSIESFAKTIPTDNPKNNYAEFVIYIPYESEILSCLNPKFITPSMFEGDALVFRAKIEANDTYHTYLNPKKGKAKSRIYKLLMFGPFKIQIEVFFLFDNIEIKTENMQTLLKQLTLWELGTKEGEQSLKKYLEKTSKANGTRL